MPVVIVKGKRYILRWAKKWDRTIVAAYQFDLKRGIFDKGCMPVDLYGITTPDKMIRDDGTCMFKELKE